MRFLKLLAAFAAILVINSANASLLTFTTTGVTDLNNGYGYDGLGLFGAAGNSLRGVAFSLSVTMSLDEFVDLNTPDRAYTGYKSVKPVTYSAVVGGHSYSSTFIPDSYAWTYSYADRSKLGAGYDNLGMDTRGTDALGGRASIIQDLLGYTSIVGDVDPFSQPFDYATGSDIREFLVFVVAGADGTQTHFSASGPVKISIRNEADHSVPEPTTMVLFGAGLLAVASIRRRRKY